AMQKAKSHERRKFERYKLDCPIFYRLLSENGEISRESINHTVNISEDGFMFNSRQNLNSGQQLEFSMTLGKSTIRGNCEVVHSERTHVNLYSLGVRFTSLTGECKRLLRRTIESLGY